MADARVNVLLKIRSQLTGLNKAVDGFKNLAATVAGFAAAYLSTKAILAGARDIIGLGAELNHLSAQTGIAESELLTLRQAFADNGVSVDQVAPSINKMQQQLVNVARTGSGPAADALRDMNLRAEDLLQLSPSEQFNTLSQSLAKIENPALRNATAMTILGEQGAKLMPLFRTGGAIDDARASLGSMPEVLQRNSVEFERIDTLMGRIPNKSRQLFAGIGDQLSAEILGPMEKLNRLDFTALGQRIGAFIGLGLEAIRDGTFGQFISLAIEAGFEQGIAGAKTLWDSIVGSESGAFWRTALAATMTFAVKTVEALIDAFTQPISYISAGFRWIASVAQNLFAEAAGATGRAFSSVINWIAGSFEGMLNGVIGKINDLIQTLGFSETIATVTFGKVKLGEDLIKPAREFSDLLREQQEGLKELGTIAKTGLSQNLQVARSIVLGTTENIEGEISATQRLNNLIENRIQNREHTTPTATGKPASETSVNRELPVRSQTFADKASEQYTKFTGTNTDGSAFQGDQGDYGVGKWAAAKAAMMDYVTSAGTVAQQIYSAIGTVASGLQQGIGSSITGLINRTMSWKDALLNIGSSVVQSVVQSFSEMASKQIVAWATKEVALTQISATGATARETILTTETAMHSANVGTQVAVHGVGETVKTESTMLGGIARMALWLGETIYHGLQIGVRTAIFIAGEVAMTAVALVQTGIRMGMILVETLAYVIKAAIGALSALASIPYVGPVLAIAAMGLMLSTGFSLAKGIKGFAVGGFTGSGDSNDPAGLVHKGEFVFPADVVSKQGPQYFYALMDSLRFDRPEAPMQGYAMGGLVDAPAARSITASPPRNSANRFNIGLFNDPAALNKWAQSQDGETTILDILKRNRHEFFA
jgi:hypothetical protein